MLVRWKQIKINDNNIYPIKLWNETLLKYQTLAEQNNEELKSTLLYSFIQTEEIQIKNNYIDTHFNSLMNEEETFDKICKEIIQIKNTKKHIWTLDKNIWKKIEFPPSVSETAKQQEKGGGESTNTDRASMKQKLSNSELDKSQKPTQKEEAADVEEKKNNKTTEKNGSLKEEEKLYSKQTLLSFHTKNKKQTHQN